MTMKLKVVRHIFKLLLKSPEGLRMFTDRVFRYSIVESLLVVTRVNY